MLRRDLSFYRVILGGLSLGELVALYERTLPEYAALAQVIAEELEYRQESVFRAAA